MSEHEQFLIADRVFDGHNVSHNVAVGISDGRVSRVLPISDVPAGAATLVLDGATLTPGLIDALVHLAPWMVYGLLAALPAGPCPTVHWSGPLLERTKVN